MAIFVMLLKTDTQQNFEQNLTTYKTYTSMQKPLHVNKTQSYTKQHIPLDVLYMKINLEQKEEKQTKQNIPKRSSYWLIVDKDDRYSMFCIKQTLEENSVAYIIYKNGAKHSIIVDDRSKEELSDIAKQLLKYDIKSKIKKVLYENNNDM